MDSPDVDPTSRFVWYEPVDPLALQVADQSDLNGHEVILGDFDAQFIRHEEPPLDNVPHTAEESVLSTTPRFVDEYQLLFDAACGNAERRRRLLEGQMQLVANHPAIGESVISCLRLISDPAGAVTNERIRSLGARQLELITRRGLDIFRGSADQEEIQRPPVTSMVRRYIEYRNQDDEERRANVLAEARGLLTDPDAIDRRNEAYDLITAAGILSDSGIAAQEAYRDGLEAAIEYVLDSEPQPYPTVTGMERWVTRWAAENSRVAESVLRKLIEAAETPEAITSVLYDVALAGFGTGNPEVMNRTAELLCWNTDLMPPDSLQGQLKEYARFNIDPEIRRKASELLDVAFSYFTITSTRGQVDFMKALLEVHKDERFKIFLARQIIAHPDIMQELGWDSSLPKSKVLRSIKIAGALARQARDTAQRAASKGLPAIFATSGSEVGPLGEWYRDFYASFSAEMHASVPLPGRRTIMAHLNFPGYSATDLLRVSADEAAARVREMIAQGPGVAISRRTYWNTLGYLVPEEVGRSEWRALIRENAAIRDEMIVDKRHSLSPRGDRLIVVGSMLQQLGFESIDYAMTPEQKDVTTVTLRVGNATFRCLLDREYNFREIGTGHNLGLGHSAPFLEFVVLSHLHQIHNTEPSRKKIGKGPGLGEPHRTAARRAHRRRLPEGDHPSEDQIFIAIDEYGIDLVRQNAMRLARGETRLITWVREVSDGIEYHDPVKTEGTKASERLIEVLRRAQSEG